MSHPRPSPASASPSSPKVKHKRSFSKYRPHSSVRVPQSAYPLSAITSASSSSGGGGGVMGMGMPRPVLSAPRHIKRPKKILYLLGIFVLLYWFGIRHGLGRERDPHLHLGFAVPGGRPHVPSLLFNGFGIALLRPGGERVKGLEHPIYELMERGEERWLSILSRQSRTLSAATKEYRRRYSMDPPLGFDAWWSFCETHNVTIRDEYDRLMHDVLPQHALTPSTWLARADALENSHHTYTFRLDQRGVRVWGPRAAFAHPRHMADLLGGLARDLPVGFEVSMTVGDEVAAGVVPKDQRERALELARVGKNFDIGELRLLERMGSGWFSACPIDSAAARPDADESTHGGEARSFIADHIPTTDYCDFPEWQRLHGALFAPHHSPARITPLGTISKLALDPSLQLAPPEGHANLTAADLEFEGVWSEKTDARVFWRGATTGGVPPSLPASGGSGQGAGDDAEGGAGAGAGAGGQRTWRDSHRLRMHLMVNDPPKGADRREVMMPDGGGGYVLRKRSDAVLGRAYMDVKLTGGAVQCEGSCAEIGRQVKFGKEILPEDAYKYKYALDLDNAGGSGRLHRLLSSASPVLKMTLFPEWNMEYLVPWYHYIPFKPDYSDLYDTMAFFAGPVDDAGKVDAAKGHDHLARKIGEAGQRFALEHWSWRDMQAYMLRLLLEVRRLRAADREAMAFRL